MLRLLGCAVLILHGMVHLLGLRPLLRRPAPASGSDTLVALAWGLAAGLLGAAAMGLGLKKPWWWVVAAGAVAVSQTLILLQWREAWAGTWLNLALALAVAVSAAFGVISRRVRAEARARATQTASSAAARRVTAAQLARLPEPARRYLTYAGVVPGQPLVPAVTVQQTGRIRTEPAGPWMALEAEQYFTVQPASFVWLATVRRFGVPLLQVQDQLLGGHGSMQVRAAGLLPLGTTRGPEMDQGSWQRYLAEAVWFPTAFLQDNVRLEAAGADAFDVHLAEDGQQVTIRLHVDAQGQLREVTARRYREHNGAFSLDDWSVKTVAYGSPAGLRIPTALRIIWKLPAGDFEPIQLSVTDLAYQPAVSASDAQATKQHRVIAAKQMLQR